MRSGTKKEAGDDDGDGDGRFSRASKDNIAHDGNPSLRYRKYE